MNREFSSWRPHPWHGLEVGPNPPAVLHAYIEVTPFDLVKYEIDKSTGYLHVDRPHKTSSLPPSLYGFVPKTYCGERVSKLMPGSLRGDQDPLDICVISERPILRAEVVLVARVVGGIPMLDDDEADDKIIAILNNDVINDGIQELPDLPSLFIARLRHYFSSYKTLPGETQRATVGEPYGRNHAFSVIQAAIADYQEKFKHE